MIISLPSGGYVVTRVCFYTKVMHAFTHVFLTRKVMYSFSHVCFYVEDCVFTRLFLRGRLYRYSCLFSLEFVKGYVVTHVWFYAKGCAISCLFVVCSKN